MTGTNIPFPAGASVVAYLRDSGGEDQDLSTSEQQAALQAWCNSHNLQLTHIFKDEARPGSSVVNRTAFNAMMSHFHDQSCQDKGVIIWKYSRFSRDFDDAQFFKADLRRRGFIIYSINDNIPDTLEGKVFETMIDWMNQRYLNDLATDIKRGLHHIVKEYGAVPGHPPPGFKREIYSIGNRRDGSPHTLSRWVIDPETAPVIKAAWKMRAEGATIRQIDQQFHLFKTRTMYSHFFKNQIYNGTLVFGDTIIKDYSPPLIDEVTWKKVQEMNAKNSMINRPGRSDNPDGPRRKSSPFLLSGLLYCSKCGSIMNGSYVQFKGKKSKEYYQCARAARQMSCDARRIPRGAIEETVINQVIEYIKDPDLLAAHESTRLERSRAKVEEAESQIKTLESEITSMKRRISSLINRLADDPNAPQSIIDTIRDMERSIADNHAKIELIKSSPLPETTIRSAENVQQLSEKMSSVLHSDDVQKKRNFIKLLINRISVQLVIDGDKAYISGMTYFYKGEYLILDLDISRDI